MTRKVALSLEPPDRGRDKPVRANGWEPRNLCGRLAASASELCTNADAEIRIVGCGPTVSPLLDSELRIDEPLTDRTQFGGRP